MTWNEASIDFLTQYGGLDLDTWHILKRFDITTIGDISLFSDEDLLAIDEFTEQNLSNLKNSIIKLTNEVTTNHLTPDVPLESTAKKEAFAEINRLQDEYVDELINLMNNPNYDSMKTIDFTSPTGTGKTKMMSKLINKMPDCYFIITTLSKGQLHIQVRNSLIKDCNQDNFTVYGSADYKINSKLDAQDIICKIPDDTKCIWLRDEGHIRTNRFDELLMDVCYKVINISATNMHNDIQCNFTSTMMLRTVNQTNGTPDDAIMKLLEVKAAHRNVAHYNPCAIFRCVGGDSNLYDRIISLCEKHNLKYIDITENSFDMAELCEDDNEYDVIINKFKIVEGIDIRRAHVLYMDNQPSNNATTIQVIGRCRRNALLYRNDIDILSPENDELLKQTRECYVYYNVEKMKIDTDEDGELQYAFCNYISCESLKPDTVINVIDGQMNNGLHVIELAGCTGQFEIHKDNNIGFNYVMPATDFYEELRENHTDYIYSYYGKIRVSDVHKLPLQTTETVFDYSLFKYKTILAPAPYYIINPYLELRDIQPDYRVPNNILKSFEDKMNIFDENYIISLLPDCKHQPVYDKHYLDNTITEYLKNHNRSPFSSSFYNVITNLPNITESYSDNNQMKTCRISDFCDEYSVALIRYYLIQIRKNRPRLGDNFAHYYVRQFLYACSRLDVLKYKITYFHKESFYDFIYEKFVLHDEMPSRELLNRTYTNKFIVHNKKDGKYFITENDVNTFFSRLESILKATPVSPIEHHYVASYITSDIRVIYSNLKLFPNSSKHDCLNIVASYSDCVKPLTEDDKFAIKNKFANVVGNSGKLSVTELQSIKSYVYSKTINDRESAIIGTDLMHQIRVDDNSSTWVETKAVSSKVGNYNKLNAFITNRYPSELAIGKAQCFTGKNSFDLDKRCNSVIGYCVEYYSKYVLYGRSYLDKQIIIAQEESKTKELNDGIIVRACMLKYKEMMIKSFGPGVAKIIKNISVSQLLQEKYSYFVNLVVELGTKTAEYVKSTLYANRPIEDNIDPNLSIRHIAGLADYITEDTILDVKVKNCIDEKCVRQVLAYHYLSTKRSDLNIKRVIVYDAVSGKAVIINIGEEYIEPEVVANSEPEHHDTINIQELYDKVKSIKQNGFVEKTKLPAKIRKKSVSSGSSNKESTKLKYMNMTRMMNCGIEATVIDYEDCHNMTIRFSDGLIKTHVRSDHFSEGKVSHVADAPTNNNEPAAIIESTHVDAIKNSIDDSKNNTTVVSVSSFDDSNQDIGFCGFDKSKMCSCKCNYFDTCTRKPTSNFTE